MVLIVVAAGAVAAVYFGVKHLAKSSEANQTAVKALHRSHVASDSLGEIQDTGFPSGEISETGASGNASFAMSVKGSRANGTYYATLQKTNGIWSVISARILLANGQSVNLDINSPDLPSNLAKSEGHQLSSSSVDQSSWRSEYWPQQLMRFSVPVDWIRKKAEQRELDYRKGERYSSTYLAGNGWINDNALPAGNLLQVEVQTASEQLHNGVIIGYAVRNVGGATGLLTISDRGDTRIATWKGLVQAGGKQREIDISLGATAHDFDNLEPTFDAILNSIRFEN
ncbi:MAG TPA: cytochrome c oxidase assembly factor Coa1 family protein [Blastocatellia bacterium]|nr:cytochrome c oxidase assembly factor Coa1 family protein [Blastocatellia bacterium]